MPKSHRPCPAAFRAYRKNADSQRRYTARAGHATHPVLIPPRNRGNFMDGPARDCTPVGTWDAQYGADDAHLFVHRGHRWTEQAEPRQRWPAGASGPR